MGTSTMFKVVVQNAEGSTFVQDEIEGQEAAQKAADKLKKSPDYTDAWIEPA